MIWRCRNAIKLPFTSSQQETHVDLYCEVIGTIKAVSWFHNGKLINVYGKLSAIMYEPAGRIVSILLFHFILLVLLVPLFILIKPLAFISDKAVCIYC
jgi:hypothetical protein